MKQYIYLSHFIDVDTPVYGGGKRIIIGSDKSISKGDSANTTSLSFCNHIGTHIDFPRHFSDDGKTINHYSPEFWIFNKPFILEYMVKKNEIINIDKEINEIPYETDFLIIKTGFQKFRGDEKYWKYNPGLAPNFALKVRKRCPHLKVIGFDFISASSFQNRELGRKAHKEFLINNDILIVEDMDLSKANNKINKIICLPLMIDNIDGSPVTIIGEINE